MKSRILNTITLFSLMLIILPGCNNKPLLTEMETSRLIVVLKGTYESNSPKSWNMPAVDSVDLVDDSVDDSNVTVGSVDTLPSLFMMDIAEIKLVDSGGKQHDFSNLRQTLTIPLDENPFFNGTGIILESDDVPSGNYIFAYIYVRKMLLSNSTKYTPVSTGWYGETSFDIFAEQVVPGFNFNQFQVNSYHDTLKLEGSFLNRVFPVAVPIVSNPISSLLHFDNENPYTVLELRLNVKNFIKKFEYGSYDANGVYSYIHYYGFSDWLNDVQSDETTIGGNILTVGRAFVPGLTGSISGTCTANRHIIAIPAGEAITNYTAPADQRKNNPCNFPRPPAGYYGPFIEQALDYYLKYEKFKSDWNLIVDPNSDGSNADSTCLNFTTYQASWDTYAQGVDTSNTGFKIPVLATYSTGGTYLIENVPAGTYDLYMTGADTTYGKLFEDGAFTTGPVTVTVSIGLTTSQNL